MNLESKIRQEYCKAQRLLQSPSRIEQVRVAEKRLKDTAALANYAVDSDHYVLPAMRRRGAHSCLLQNRIATVKDTWTGSRGYESISQSIRMAEEAERMIEERITQDISLNACVNQNNMRRNVYLCKAAAKYIAHLSYREEGVEMERCAAIGDFDEEMQQAIESCDVTPSLGTNEAITQALQDTRDVLWHILGRMRMRLGRREGYDALKEGLNEDKTRLSLLYDLREAPTKQGRHARKKLEDIKSHHAEETIKDRLQTEKDEMLHVLQTGSVRSLDVGYETFGVEGAGKNWLYDAERRLVYDEIIS